MKKVLKTMLILSYAMLVVCMFGYTIFKVHGYTYDPVANEIQPTGIIDIITHPSGAEIYLNEGEYGVRSNTVIRPGQGKHTLEIKKEGFNNYVIEIDVDLHKANLLNIYLTADSKQKNPEKILRNVDGIFINEYDSSKMAIADHESSRIIIFDIANKKILTVIQKTGKVDEAKWFDKNTIAFMQNKNIRIHNTLTKSETRAQFIPENYNKYLADDTIKEFTKIIPFVKESEVQNFLIDWGKQILIYNDENSIYKCNINERSCETLIRFSDTIQKTEYIKNRGVLIQNSSGIKFFDYQITRDVIEIKSSILFSYLRNSGEILFTKDGTLYKWKIFYN